MRKNAIMHDENLGLDSFIFTPSSLNYISISKNFTTSKGV